MTQNNPHNEMPDFHMLGLARSGCAKDYGELTVVLLGYVTSLQVDAYNKGVEVERKRTAEIMDRVICGRWAGIENCPLDPLGQCEKCQGRALYHRQLEKALTPLPEVSL